MAARSRQAKLVTPTSFLEHCENSMTAGLDHESWSVADSADLYEVARWGNGYFSIADDGIYLFIQIEVPKRHVDLKKLIDRLEVRGIGLPVLLAIRRNSPA